MLWLYRILFLPGLLLLAPAYLWRMRRRGGYRDNFAHRFGGHQGLPPRRPGVRRVWLQAVSVGELLAIESMVDTIRATSAGGRVSMATEAKSWIFLVNAARPAIRVKLSRL